MDESTEDTGEYLDVPLSVWLHLLEAVVPWPSVESAPIHEPLASSTHNSSGSGVRGMVPPTALVSATRQSCHIPYVAFSDLVT